MIEEGVVEGDPQNLNQLCRAVSWIYGQACSKGSLYISSTFFPANIACNSTTLLALPFAIIFAAISTAISRREEQ